MTRDETMRLSELLQGGVPPEMDREVSGLALDSRRLRPGDAFVAVAGRRDHGLRHLDEALAAGAVAVLVDEAVETVAAPVPVVQVRGLRWRLGELATRLYQDPSEALQVVGVTGTNGKTSVAGFLAQALGADGPVGHLGTLGEGLWGRLEPARNTTPDVFTVHRRLAEARDAGARFAVMEVSSHALDQDRVAGVRFACAVFTNLSRDHLDYHRDMAAYGAAKARLFHDLAPRVAVINRDDAFGERLSGTVAAPVWDYRFSDGPARVRGRILRLDESGLSLELAVDRQRAQVTTALLGRFQAHNLAAAAAVLLALGMPLDEAARRLGGVSAPPGRMEPFRRPGRPLVVVDYAHTPDALSAALAALRPHTRGRLWCVFGCGGERDPGKRPLMGRCAEAGADRVIVTDDNPRGEDPGAIAAQILAGMTRPEAVTVIHDRAEAIAHALSRAAPDDVVLLAGKGHETTQQVGGQVLSHDDRAWARELLEGEG